MWVKTTQDVHLYNNEYGEHELHARSEKPICISFSLLRVISARCYFTPLLMFCAPITFAMHYIEPSGD